jgi:hypothetical protein
MQEATVWNNRYLRMNYSGMFLPQVNDLPVIDSSNPLFITEGNPDLKPETRHRVEGSFNQFNPATIYEYVFQPKMPYNVNQVIYNRIH